METHTTLGEQLLRGVSFLRGTGLEVVRSHHERWDGRGYPDRRRGEGDPVRGPHLRRGRRARRDDERPAVPPRDELGRGGPRVEQQSGRQFDPAVVDAFRARERSLRRIRRELAESALVA